MPQHRNLIELNIILSRDWHAIGIKHENMAIACNVSHGYLYILSLSLLDSFLELIIQRQLITEDLMQWTKTIIIKVSNILTPWCYLFFVSFFIWGKYCNPNTKIVEQLSQLVITLSGIIIFSLFHLEEIMMKLL